ncbi:MAG: phosphatidylserine/phosphatidylglycerophosphate/cardiolipin synthase family protein, partial [Gemmatimonadaceae bacterium]|nr:phosphatidylserine/phosphatidylglycerophosphate/cardiolipin synthase family protein [Gemmatimonadaceae bacterium]
MTGSVNRVIAGGGKVIRHGARTDSDRVLARSAAFAHATNRVEWLIDNAQLYARLLESLRHARKSVHIAQLAFDADCAAFASDSPAASSVPDTVLADTLIDLASDTGPEVRILLNASWMLNTARPLRKFFAQRGVAPNRIEVRGMNRFPHFMHAKIVLIDAREAYLLGSPFVNSYWDDGGHAPFDARRPMRELGGRPLHDVSVHLRGTVVGDLESMFASVWRACGAIGRHPPAPRSVAPAPHARASGMRVVSDAPDGMLPNAPVRARAMLGELLAAIGRARSFIYIEHQYLSSRAIAAALARALRATPALEIIVVLNQNPDITAYRGWQNAQLTEHALLTHPRVGVFTLWSTDAHPVRDGVTRINQLFIHSKVIVIDDEWAAVGSSNLDGVSLGDYGSDFASALGRRIFRGVRNVEVNVVIDARSAAEEGDAGERRTHEAESIAELRERL